MKRTIAVIISFILILSACKTTENYANDVNIRLSDDKITVNGNTHQKPPGDVPAPPNGERPEPPNGFEDNYNAAVSKTFTITKGENQFTNVSLSNREA